MGKLLGSDRMPTIGLSLTIGESDAANTHATMHVATHAPKIDRDIATREEAARNEAK